VVEIVVERAGKRIELKATIGRKGGGG